METRDYCAELYEKMRAEQIEYLKELLAQGSQEALNHAYEFTVREDILMAMEDMELTPKQAKALLKSPCPLADVYKDFSKLETDHMETIRDTIENRANDVIKREKDKESR